MRVVTTITLSEFDDGRWSASALRHAPGRWARGLAGRGEGTSVEAALEAVTEDLRRAEEDACEDCGGTGEIVLNPRWPGGRKPYSEKCSTCGGTGKRPE